MQNNEKYNYTYNIKQIGTALHFGLMISLYLLDATLKQQSFHPSGESIRPAIRRRFWGRHIKDIASPSLLGWQTVSTREISGLGFFRITELNNFQNGNKGAYKGSNA